MEATGALLLKFLFSSFGFSFFCVYVYLPLPSKAGGKSPQQDNQEETFGNAIRQQIELGAKCDLDRTCDCPLWQSLHSISG